MKLISEGHNPSKANGTFGELLQGILPNKRNFMVTFPINLFTSAIFIPAYNSGAEIKVIPEHKLKSLTFAENLLKYFNINVGGTLIIDSQVPEGKGLASSSADLVATAYAISKALGIVVNENIISRLIYSIEPSDGVMYPGIVSFYYKELELIEYIGTLPSLEIIAIDEGGTIDTLEYNARRKYHCEVDAMKYQYLLFYMTNGIRNKDILSVGRIATQSAMMNQKNNPKKFLDSMLDICSEVEAVGVSVAHSGTFIGIVLNPNDSNHEYKKELCLEKIQSLSREITIFYSRDFC